MPDQLPVTWLRTRGAANVMSVEGVDGKDLSNADLTELQVYEPSAQGTLFCHADFTDFRCKGGDFSGADFTGACLNNAIFFDTLLESVKMNGILMQY
jgi:uncharacterized protein YjbI with pentapeptide repeats